MVLAKDEELLKEWEYAAVRQGDKTTHYMLEITNKRVVSKTKNANLCTREEIRVDNIKGISCSRGVSSKLGFAIAMLILGIGCLILTLTLKAADIKISFLLLGILLIIIGVCLLNSKKSMFVLTIDYKGGNSNINIGVSNMSKKMNKTMSKAANIISIRGLVIVLLLLFFPPIGLICLALSLKKSKNEFKVVVNDDAAEEIMETLGSLIL